MGNDMSPTHVFKHTHWHLYSTYILHLILCKSHRKIHSIKPLKIKIKNIKNIVCSDASILSLNALFLFLVHQ